MANFKKEVGQQKLCMFIYIISTIFTSYCNHFIIRHCHIMEHLRCRIQTTFLIEDVNPMLERALPSTYFQVIVSLSCIPDNWFPPPSCQEKEIKDMDCKVMKVRRMLKELLTPKCLKIQQALLDVSPSLKAFLEDQNSSPLF